MCCDLGYDELASLNVCITVVDPSLSHTHPNNVQLSYHILYK